MFGLKLKSWMENHLGRPRSKSSSCSSKRSSKDSNSSSSSNNSVVNSSFHSTTNINPISLGASAPPTSDLKGTPKSEKEPGTSDREPMLPSGSDSNPFVGRSTSRPSITKLNGSSSGPSLRGAGTAQNSSSNLLGSCTISLSSPDTGYSTDGYSPRSGYPGLIFETSGKSTPKSCYTISSLVSCESKQASLEETEEEQYVSSQSLKLQADLTVNGQSVLDRKGCKGGEVKIAKKSRSFVLTSGLEPLIEDKNPFNNAPSLQEETKDSLQNDASHSDNPCSKPLSSVRSSVVLTESPQLSQFRSPASLSSAVPNSMTTSPFTVCSPSRKERTRIKTNPWIMSPLPNHGRQKNPCDRQATSNGQINASSIPFNGQDPPHNSFCESNNNIGHLAGASNDEARNDKDNLSPTSLSTSTSNSDNNHGLAANNGGNGSDSGQGGSLDLGASNSSSSFEGICKNSTASIATTDSLLAQNPSIMLHENDGASERSTCSSTSSCYNSKNPSDNHNDLLLGKCNEEQGSISYLRSVREQTCSGSMGSCVKSGVQAGLSQLKGRKRLEVSHANGAKGKINTVGNVIYEVPEKETEILSDWVKSDEDGEDMETGVSTSSMEDATTTDTGCHAIRFSSYSNGSFTDIDSSENTSGACTTMTPSSSYVSNSKSNRNSVSSVAGSSTCSSGLCQMSYSSQSYCSDLHKKREKGVQMVPVKVNHQQVFEVAEERISSIVPMRHPENSDLFLEPELDDNQRREYFGDSSSNYNFFINKNKSFNNNDYADKSSGSNQKSKKIARGAIGFLKKIFRKGSCSSDNSKQFDEEECEVKIPGLYGKGRAPSPTLPYPLSNTKTIGKSVFQNQFFTPTPNAFRKRTTNLNCEAKSNKQYNLNGMDALLSGVGSNAKNNVRSQVPNAKTVKTDIIRLPGMVTPQSHCHAYSHHNANQPSCYSDSSSSSHHNGSESEREMSVTNNASSHSTSGSSCSSRSKADKDEPYGRIMCVNSNINNVNANRSLNSPVNLNGSRQREAPRFYNAPQLSDVPISRAGVQLRRTSEPPQPSSYGSPTLSHGKMNSPTFNNYSPIHRLVVTGGTVNHFQSPGSSFGKRSALDSTENPRLLLKRSMAINNRGGTNCSFDSESHLVGSPYSFHPSQNPPDFNHSQVNGLQNKHTSYINQRASPSFQTPPVQKIQSFTTSPSPILRNPRYQYITSSNQNSPVLNCPRRFQKSSTPPLYSSPLLVQSNHHSKLNGHHQMTTFSPRPVNRGSDSGYNEYETPSTNPLTRSSGVDSSQTNNLCGNCRIDPQNQRTRNASPYYSSPVSKKPFSQTFKARSDEPYHELSTFKSRNLTEEKYIEGGTSRDRNHYSISSKSPSCRFDLDHSEASQQHSHKRRLALSREEIYERVDSSSDYSQSSASGNERYTESVKRASRFETDVRAYASARRRKSSDSRPTDCGSRCRSCGESYRDDANPSIPCGSFEARSIVANEGNERGCKLQKSKLKLSELKFAPRRDWREEEKDSPSTPLSMGTQLSRTETKLLEGDNEMDRQYRRLINEAEALLREISIAKQQHGILTDQSKVNNQHQFPYELQQYDQYCPQSDPLRRKAYDCWAMKRLQKELAGCCASPPVLHRSRMSITSPTTPTASSTNPFLVSQPAARDDNDEDELLNSIIESNRLAENYLSRIATTRARCR